jgi:putative nucleotidyltransferase with HDIG domain
MRPGISSGSIFDMDWADWIASDRWRSSLDALPMVPAVAREVLEFAADSQVSVKRIVNVVSRDPVLASRVLRLANSVYSGSALHITSISGAIVRLGTESVRNLITAVCVASILASKGRRGNAGRELVDHGIGTAYIASFIADAAGEPREQAFACGLLHDIGKLLIDHLAHQRQEGVKRPTAEELSTVMARHAEFGGYLVKLWKLPEPFHEAVAFHHEPALAPGSRPAAVTYAANRLAHQYGFGCRAEDFDPMADPVFAAVNVEAGTLARIRHQAPMLYEVARQLAA